MPKLQPHFVELWGDLEYW